MFQNYFRSHEEEDDKSKTLEIILIAVIVGELFTAGGFIDMQEYGLRWALSLIARFSLCITLLILNRLHYTRIASLLLILGLWIITTIQAFTGGGVATLATFLYVIIVYIAGILLGSKAGFATAFVCILTLIGLVIIEMTGFMPFHPIPYTSIARLMVLITLILIMTGLQYIAARSIGKALRQTRLELAERKRTEGALRESERRFSDTLINLQMIAVMCDDKGIITFCNDYLLRLTGWEREEAVGRNWFEMFVPEDQQKRVSELLDDLPLKGSVIPHFENEIKTRTGMRRLVKWTNTTLRDLDGQTIGVAALGDDITEQKHTEEENQKLLQQLKERVKELTALHEAARILQRQMTDIPRVLHDLTKLLPPAFQYSETIAARIRLGQNESATPSFADSSEALRTDFTTADGQSGNIEVIYTKDHPPEKEKSFLTEERELVNTLADMLQTFYDRHQAEEQIRTTTEQLRALTARLRHAREEEGTRIAREIHDELGSALTSLRWELESINKASDSSEKQLKPQALQEKTDLMMNQIDATINVVRRIASELRPSILDDLGLVEAIEWQVQQFQERTKIFCQFNYSQENIDLNQEKSTAVFRIFQEALTNILRHAGATRVDITSEKRHDYLILTISDNGKGIAEQKRTGTKSLGILGMRERAFLVGGEIEITGIEGKGTVLTVRVPIAG